ncbi:ROK family transcriptional regulator [Buchananella hordeovulneris]|uniref:ROK family transcriptional regulator n=1 Tax=Buchananella hordeovulneris TaxID=52770 RepID=UPI000F5F1F28|nr:ROK family protein [Buchananella hordeovulneris]MDO5080497.1 ROK family protein [Buchananella hordeovulneris]RRD44624.1 ROK family protein [Buchananella hordeovulneris]
MARPSSPPSARAATRVLAALAEAHWATIAELAHAADLSRPTVLGALTLFTEFGWIEAQQRPSAAGSGGRPAESYRLAPQAATCLVARLWAREVSALLLDATGRPLAQGRVPLAEPRQAAAVLQQLVADLQQQTHRSELTLAVVATMGICRQGRVLESVVFPQLVGSRVADDLAERWGCSVDFDNDANLSALAQLADLGRDDPHLSMVAIHVDESPGCGLIVNQQLWQGAHGAAGELAFGADMSWHVMERRLRQAAAARQCTPRDIFQAARAGDRAARALMAQAIDALADGIIKLLLVLDPHVLSLAGPGVQSELWAARLQRRLAPHVPRLPEIVVREMDESVLAGGCLRACEQLRQQREQRLRSLPGLAPVAHPRLR